MPAARHPPQRNYNFVAHSEIRVPAGGEAALADAFRARLHLVERWPGFGSIEVWRDEHDSTRFVMVSWWQRRDDFLAYMRSGDHRASHNRIPTGDLAPRPDSFTRYDVVAR